VGTCTRTLAGTAKTVITGVKSMTFSPIASGAGTLSYPATPSSSPTLAAIAMTLQVQITNHGLTSNGVNVTSATSGTSPIVLQATADLRNFG
jgi:hypothetical protein